MISNKWGGVEERVVFIPAKAAEAREKDASLEGTENVRDAQKTVAEAAWMQERLMPPFLAFGENQNQLHQFIHN